MPLMTGLVWGFSLGLAVASADSPRIGQPEIALTPFEAVYRASLDAGLTLNARATRRLEQQEDGNWLFRFDVSSLLADRTESVRFAWDGQRVIPQQYHYSLSGWVVSNRQARLDFDWSRQRVLNDVMGQPWYLDIQPGVLDKLGFQLQLRQDVKRGKRRMRYQVADGGLLKTYEFAVEGREMLSTANQGEVETLLVHKVKAPYRERDLRLWLAPAWDYLVVRMVQEEEDGSRHEIQLERARFPDRVILPGAYRTEEGQ